MADIESKIENEEKLTDEELEQVAGGTRYYDAEIYEQYGIVTMDDGKTFLYGNHEITEQLRKMNSLMKFWTMTRWSR